MTDFYFLLLSIGLNPLLNQLHQKLYPLPHLHLWLRRKASQLNLRLHPLLRRRLYQSQSQKLRQHLRLRRPLK
jgi:hypothetical protein